MVIAELSECSTVPQTRGMCGHGLKKAWPCSHSDASAADGGVANGMMNGGDDSANGSADSHHKAEYAAEDEFDDDAAERKADELDAAETGGVSEKGGDGGGMRVTFQVG